MASVEDIPEFVKNWNQNKTKRFRPMAPAARRIVKKRRIVKAYYLQDNIIGGISIIFVLTKSDTITVLVRRTSLIRDKRDFLQGLVFGTVGLNLLFGRALLTFIFAGPGIVNSIGLVGLVRSELDGFLHIGLLLVFRLTKIKAVSWFSGIILA
ncbi:hypothetical protein BDF21DRAFT_484693 [Thamnidium elegans]|nr:hypothetical protein BDF21DRAFT_484693 [Thamnidium elegans]